jgi:hypothetical protein
MPSPHFVEKVKDSLALLFRDGTVTIQTDVTNQWAEAGNGRWNSITTTVSVDGEVVYEQTGTFDPTTETN